MDLTVSESNAIKYIRVCSMLAIITCHICQAYSQTNKYAYIFNVGVQVFIALSGYIYGKKRIDDWKRWGVNRIRRIYLPVILFLVLVLPLYLVFHRDYFNWKAYFVNYLNLQGFSFVLGGIMIQGIRHLWFITAILIAYTTTPILQKVSRFSDVLMPLLISLIVIGFLILPSPDMFILSWVYIYTICYLYNYISYKHSFNIILSIAAICLVCCTGLSGWDTITSYFDTLNRAVHDVVGVFIVLFGVRILSNTKIAQNQVPYVVGLFDKYSFYIFIIHYFLIIGPFSLSEITNNHIVNIAILLFATTVATTLFVFLVRLVSVVLSKTKFLNVL